ncbi:conditioned medium-induced protein 4 [Halostagnicola sp. A56]|uniref:hypothetical protein n=1 Tax=Halostagnicola sp. A56 TaxID=1495067 RepID=UPI0004A17DD1|nr:hypothetical protein [Halostagnicola sp. A56]KDE58265.1 conditioned medium-induced protein 4 [Halostagnicola sp. A56]
MNEKTEELRDIFTNVTDGEETVTESQTATRGSLEKDERTIDERLENVIAQMRERYGFETALSDEELIRVAKGFYDDVSDDDLASELEVSSEDIFDARLSLHLIDDADAPEIDLVAVREREDADLGALADEYETSEARVRRARRVAAAQDESRAANDRYRDEFDSILGDSELTDRLASDVREDGLEDATEGMETDVSL